MGIFLSNAQIFSWKNPNLPKDTLKRTVFFPQKDSIIAAKLEQDIFTKDTLDFVKTSNRIIVDEAVLAKNDKKDF